MTAFDVWPWSGSTEREKVAALFARLGDYARKLQEADAVIGATLASEGMTQRVRDARTELGMAAAKFRQINLTAQTAVKRAIDARLIAPNDVGYVQGELRTLDDDGGYSGWVFTFVTAAIGVFLIVAGLIVFPGGAAALLIAGGTLVSLVASVTGTVQTLAEPAGGDPSSPNVIQSVTPALPSAASIGAWVLLPLAAIVGLWAWGRRR